MAVVKGEAVVLAAVAARHLPQPVLEVIVLEDGRLGAGAEEAQRSHHRLLLAGLLLGARDLRLEILVDHRDLGEQLDAARLEDLDRVAHLDAPEAVEVELLVDHRRVHQVLLAARLRHEQREA